MQEYQYGGRLIVSQEPKAYKGPDRNAYLDRLLQVVSAVEAMTGYKWKVTSFVRHSPNHKTACALDIAPDISKDSEKYYAVHNNSDPVLYKRIPLIRSLQRLASEFVPDTYDVGIFIEPDHLHINLFQPESIIPVIKIIKWKQPKPVYSDTEQRMKLPMTETGYSC